MILAFDQSSKSTGLCKGRPEGPVSLLTYRNPSFGSRKSGFDYGRALRSYARWLESQIEGVTLIAMESPVSPYPGMSVETGRILYGIANEIEKAASRHGLRCVEFHNQTVKALVYGKGGKKLPEPELQRRAGAWGVLPANGDEADAFGVYLTAVRDCFPDAMPAWTRRRAAA